MICSKCGTKSTGTNQKCFICGGDLIPEENENNNSVQQPKFNNSFMQPNVMNNESIENKNTINQNSVNMNNDVNLFNSELQQSQINYHPVQDNNLNMINNQVPQSQPMFNQTSINSNLNVNSNNNSSFSSDNKKNNKMIIILLVVLVIGALVFGISKVIGKNSSGTGETSSKSDDYFVYYEDAKLLKNIESVKLQEGISYKKIDYDCKKEYYSKEPVACYILAIYNDNDEAYQIYNSINPIPAHSAVSTITKVEDLETTLKGISININGSISKDDYKFDKYVLNKERGRIEAHFTFNGNGENKTRVRMYGVKDGKILNNISGSSSDASKKGDKVVFNLGNVSGLNFDEYDYFIYFIDGYYN